MAAASGTLLADHSRARQKTAIIIAVITIPISPVRHEETLLSVQVWKTV